MPFYAQLNDNNICTSVSSLSDEVDYPNMMEIESYDTTLLGKHWNGTEWEEVPKPQPVPQQQEEHISREEFDLLDVTYKYITYFIHEEDGTITMQQGEE